MAAEACWVTVAGVLLAGQVLAAASRTQVPAGRDKMLVAASRNRPCPETCLMYQMLSRIPDAFQDIRKPPH